MSTHLIDEQLRQWSQGDVALDVDLEFIHLADLSRPHSPTSIEIATAIKEERTTVTLGTEVVADRVNGVAVLTQTCDIVRSSEERPFIEVAPLVWFEDSMVEQIRRLQRPAFAYVSSVSPDGWVVDLDRVMTVEKAILVNWKQRKQGCSNDAERREFARAIARKRLRFAFPDDFVQAMEKFRRHLIQKHKRQTEVGRHLRALQEIRVRAAPSWDHETVELIFWFIKSQDPEEGNFNWSEHTESWSKMIDTSGRFDVNFAVACELEDITARDYVESDLLDLDSLSVPTIQS